MRKFATTVASLRVAAYAPLSEENSEMVRRMCSLRFNALPFVGRALVAGVLIMGSGCGPKAVRGGPGTSRPNLDEKALSTKLDREDIDYLVRENLDQLYKSPFWMRDIIGAPSGPPLVAIWPIQNNTSMHLDTEMDQLLGSVETNLVNSGLVGVVSRERQSEMAEEVGVQQGSAFNPNAAAQMGRQLGARYYVTGKISTNEERDRRQKRVQYTLFLQVLEVETSLVKFQFESIRSKAIL